VVVGVLEGRQAVAVVRATVGATNPVAAAPGLFSSVSLTPVWAMTQMRAALQS